MKPNTQVSEPAPATIGHNSGERAGGMPRPVPLDRIVIWPPAEAQINDMTEIAFETELEIVARSGQRCSAIGRERADGAVEVVAKAFVVEVAQRAGQHSVDVIIHKLSDEQAFRYLAQDIDAGPDWSSLARGRIFLDAVERFGTVEAAAKACRVSKATISKNVDVARSVAVVGAKVAVQREIAQRDAAWLMAVVGRKPDESDAPSADDRKAVLAAIEAIAVAPAGKVFASLRRAIVPAPRPRKGVDAIMHDDVEIGTVTRKKAGPIRIELANAGDIELDVLMRLLKKAIQSKRQPSA